MANIGLEPAIFWVNPIPKLTCRRLVAARDKNGVSNGGTGGLEARNGQIRDLGPLVGGWIILLDAGQGSALCSLTSH